MLESIKYMNKYLEEHLSPIPVTLSGKIDYKNNDQIISVSWPSEDSISGVSFSKTDAVLRIECYSKKTNFYDHREMAKTVKALFKHHIVLENGDVLEQVGEIQTNYLPLDGANKANILINIRKER